LFENVANRLDSSDAIDSSSKRRNGHSKKLTENPSSMQESVNAYRSTSNFEAVHLKKFRNKTTVREHIVQFSVPV